MDYKKFWQGKRSLIIMIVVLVGISLMGGIGLAIQVEKKIEAKKNKIWTTYKVEAIDKTYIDEIIESAESKKYYKGSYEINEIKVSDKADISSGDTLFTIKDNSVKEEIDKLESKLDELEIRKSMVSGEEEDKKEQKDSIDNQITSIKKDIKELEDKLYKDVKSPFDGIIELENDNPVNSEDIILSVQSNDLCIKTEINENEIGKISENEEIVVRINALSKSLKGKITDISTKPTRRDDKKKLSFYEVTIELVLEDEEKELNIMDGFHTKIAFDMHDTIKLPISTVTTKDNKSYVFKSYEGVLSKREVKVERSDEKFVYISEGIDIDDVIIKYPDETLKNNQQIKTDEVTEPANEENKNNENEKTDENRNEAEE